MPSGNVMGFKQSIVQNQGGPKESYSSILKPSLVLDDSCLVNRDLMNCVMYKVLQFSSINNLQVLLSNEGKERIVWVDIEGVPLNAWTRLTFQKISSKCGELGNVFWARAKELFVWSPSFKDVPEKELFSNDESTKINEQANNLNNDEVENASEVLPGFDDLVSKSWNSFTLDDSNGDVVGPDFCIAVKWFFDQGDFAIGCNSSFVALIPKVLDPKVVSDYRPISLIGSLYKVVTKILASRLSLVISDLISDVQTAFLPNRQILDGPFIINEILARCKLKKQQAMIFKSISPEASDSFLRSQSGSSFQRGIWAYLSQINPYSPEFISALLGSCNGHVLSAASIRTWQLHHNRSKAFGRSLVLADILLKLSFPRLFALEENKDISVADKMNTSISSSFRRHVRGGMYSLPSIACTLRDHCVGIRPLSSVAVWRKILEVNL
ncbi:RNA-directed DNA polymerase, eukaryota [Tanacetum coccineum]